ncbi:MAG: PulJ/GspJ family protein [Bacteriovoracaceae bacterium]
MKKSLKIFLEPSGFSILEILIAISLLGFITIGVVALTNDATNSKERISAEDKEKMQILTALSVLEWDLSHLYSPMYYAKKLPVKGRITEEIYNKIQDRFERNPHFGFTDIDGRPVPIFENSDKHSFEFYTDSNRRRQANVKQSNFAWVKYTLEAEEAKDGNDTDLSGKFKLMRYFSAENPYRAEKLNSGTDNEKIKAQVILENVEDLEFFFWNPENQKFVTPITAVAGAQNMIRAVQVKITWKDKLGGTQKIDKIYRPLWPVFDPNEDPDDLDLSAQNPNAPVPNGGGVVPPGDLDE